MATQWTDGTAAIEEMRQRAATLAAALQAAHTQSVDATSDDGAVQAGAAGGRLTTVSITAAGDGLKHEALVAALLQAARGALHESAVVIAEAAADAGSAR